MSDQVKTQSEEDLKWSGARGPKEGRVGGKEGVGGTKEKERKRKKNDEMRWRDMERRELAMRKKPEDSDRTQKKNNTDKFFVTLVDRHLASRLRAWFYKSNEAHYETPKLDNKKFFNKTKEIWKYNFVLSKKKKKRGRWRAIWNIEKKKSRREEIWIIEKKKCAISKRRKKKNEISQRRSVKYRKEEMRNIEEKKN